MKNVNRYLVFEVQNYLIGAEKCGGGEIVAARCTRPSNKCDTFIIIIIHNLINTKIIKFTNSV